MSPTDHTPVYSIIVAHDPNLLIGDSKKKDLPWHYPEDLNHFKRTTQGQPLLMGRTTFESLGSKPLPGRPCIVITSRKLDGVKCFKSVDEATNYFYTSEYQRIFIAGGARVYKEMLPVADELIITEIKKEYEGDVYFPEYRDQIGKTWREMEVTEHPEFTIRTYIRKS